MRLLSFRGKGRLCALALLLALGGAAWLNRTTLLTWYYLRGLAGASPQDRAVWVERVAGLEEEALPGLFDQLGRADVPPCANAEAVLSCLVRRWGAGDSRTVRLVGRLTERFARLSGPGQEAVLELVLATLPDRGKAA